MVRRRRIIADVITEIDYSVGRIIDALEKNNLSDNTIVVFTSDNGPWLSYGDHAGSSGIYREGKGTTWRVELESLVSLNIQKN